MNLNDLTGIIGLSLGILTFIGGLIAYYRGSVEKGYAAKRDFGHLKNNYQQLATNQDQILREQDERFDRLDLTLARIEALLINRKQNGL
jgi:hypothetical protein